MNKLKDHCKEHYKYFLTYADNNAIGYFKKQGFHKNLKMSKEQYREYIKDYDGGTLMEAEIEQKIDYSNLSDILKQQKDSIVKYCQKFLNVKRKHSYYDLEKELEKKGININNLYGKKDKDEKEKNKNDDDIEITKELFDCIPGIKDSGWTYEEYQTQCEKEKLGENENFLTQCRNIINKLKDQVKSKDFREPVDEKNAPGYHEKIKEPMDLSTLEKNVESGKYRNKNDFKNDLKKIFNNAKIYNPENSHYYKDAEYLESFIEPDLKKLKES